MPAEEEILSQIPDDYEQEEHFTLKFILPAHAIQANADLLQHIPPDKPRYQGMLERENRIFAMMEERIHAMR